MWPSEYLPIPYERAGRSRSGADCWGLVCLIYRDRRGIELPGFQYSSLTEARSHIAVGMAGTGWREVDAPAALDVALFQFVGHPLHVGVVIGPEMPGDMIHAMQGVGVSVEPFRGKRWGSRLCGFWRPAIIPA